MVWINGGLGNQVFQYIFMRYLEEKTGKEYILDDLIFYGEDKYRINENGYELDTVFSIEHPRLTTSFDADVLQDMFSMVYPNWPLWDMPSKDGRAQSVVSIFDSCGIQMTPVQEEPYFQITYPRYNGRIYSYPVNGYSPDITNIKEDIYCLGWWINGHYFKEIKDVLLHELVFPPIPDEKNLKLYKEMLSSTSSVAIHIRAFREDIPDLSSPGMIDPKWYVAVLEQIRQKIRSPVFYIFTDKPDRFNKIKSSYGFYPKDTCILVTGNYGSYKIGNRIAYKNYIDMQLMSVCRIMIIANSSFSYLAALLNKREDKLVWNPTKREIF